MCIFVTIPIAILITMGKEFFTLWVPEQPSGLLYELAVITAIGSCIVGPAQPLCQIFTVTNKIRQSGIVSIVYGFSSIVVTVLILKFTTIGLPAVTGISMLGAVIVALA